jgi:hypothetical protein
VKRAPVKPVSGGAPTRKCLGCGEWFVVYDDTRICPDCEGEREDETPDVVDLIERRSR